MTRQETFKKRVRARMERTGERYAAARRVLLDAAARAERSGTRVRVSQPEFTDEVIRQKTGRSWDEWCDLIDAEPGRAAGHAAIAAHLHARHGVDHWWAHGITVGYERITGLRLPYQMADGTFTATRSRTLDVDPGELRALLLDAETRADLIPGLDLELRSRATSKSLRFRTDPGAILLSFDPAPGGRAKVVVTHEKLPEFDLVEQWRHYWGEWLDALDAET